MIDSSQAGAAEEESIAAPTRARRRPKTKTAGGIPVRRVGIGSRLRRDWPLIVMTLPAVLALLVFHYLPMLGNVMAFQDYSSYTDAPFPLSFFKGQTWVGFAQFQRLFGDADFWHAALNTVELVGLQILLFFPLPIFLALLLSSLKSYWSKAITQSVFYLPHFLSWVVTISVFSRVLGATGILNDWLPRMGLGTTDVMTNSSTFPMLVVAQVVWKDAGWSIIIFLATLAGVASELHEAAAVDGAGRWRRLWHVTLPALRPIILLLLIMRLGDALSVGFEQFILQRNAVGPGAAEVLDTYVYYTGVESGDYSYGAAAGLFKGLVGLVLILVANKVAHQLGEDGVYRRA